MWPRTQCRKREGCGGLARIPEAFQPLLPALLGAHSLPDPCHFVLPLGHLLFYTWLTGGGGAGPRWHGRILPSQPPSLSVLWPLLLSNLSSPSAGIKMPFHSYRQPPSTGAGATQGKGPAVGVFLLCSALDPEGPWLCSHCGEAAGLGSSPEPFNSSFFISKPE